MSYNIEMLWTCSICGHDANGGLRHRYCGNCGHKKDVSDPERMPADTSEAAALKGEADRKANAGSDWICKYCEANQNQLNNHCGNCGGDKAGTMLVSPRRSEEIGAQPYLPRPRRRTFTPDTWTADPEPEVRPRRRLAPWLLGIAGVGLLIWLTVWLFTPHIIQTKVNQLYWQHDTLIERYAVHRHEGWTPSYDAFEVIPAGMRHHHYDRVHVGSHDEPYQESYACGSYPTTTTCSSNSNGTARCSKSGGGTKYCTRTRYRTVQDYKDVSRKEMWWMWKAWDWAYHRTVTHSGFTHATTWPSKAELTAWLGDGEKERSFRRAGYKVTFVDLKDGETYFIRPEADGFQSYDLGDLRTLKVTRAGSVEVLP